MYKLFYRLTRNPFELSPDPRFFFSTPRHNEALASLCYGVQKRKGFVVLTGEVGTGKTLLVRCLLDWLDRYKIAFSHVFNTRLSVSEFMQYFLSDLGLPVAGKSKGEMISQLNHYLIDRYRQGSTAVLIIDEAQLLEWDLLEEVRLLTNLETGQQKLLQILLIGQPELDQKLESVNLRQLKQRIALRYQLTPLSEEETRAYILRRLQVAGANSHAAGLFPGETLAAIVKFSRGVPRLINTICENALIAGFARQAKVITPDIVEEIAGDFRLDVPPQTLADPSYDQRHALLKEIFRVIETLDATKSGTPGLVAAERGVKV